MARLLPTLLLLSPLLVNAMNYRDHEFYVWEKCSDDFNSTGYWEWQPTACVDSFCTKPMGNSQLVGTALYCMPFTKLYAVPRASADTYSPVNPPQILSATECSSFNSNITCAAGTSCTSLWGDCTSKSGGCCWPTDPAAATAAAKAEYAAAADRTPYGAIKLSFEVCQYDFDCVDKTELCMGFIRGQAYADLGGPLVTYPINNAGNGGYNARLTTGFCSPVDLPQCNTTSDCPTNYACGISNTCFPLNNSQVPASYFLTTSAPASTAANHTSAPSTAATATGTVCGVGLQACGAACYDPAAQSGYTCQNGQLAQVHATQTATATGTGTAVPTTAAGSEVTHAATEAPITTDAATTAGTDGASSTEAPAATTAAASLATTAAPVTSAPSTATLTGINSDKSKTGAAASMMQHSVLPIILTAAAAAVAL